MFLFISLLDSFSNVVFFSVLQAMLDEDAAAAAAAAYGCPSGQDSLPLYGSPRGPYDAYDATELGHHLHHQQQQQDAWASATGTCPKISIIYCNKIKYLFYIYKN